MIIRIFKSVKYKTWKAVRSKVEYKRQTDYSFPQCSSLNSICVMLLKLKFVTNEASRIFKCIEQRRVAIAALLASLFLQPFAKFSQCYLLVTLQLPLEWRSMLNWRRPCGQWNLKFRAERGTLWRRKASFILQASNPLDSWFSFHQNNW